MSLSVRQYEPRDAEAVRELHERALRDVGVYDEEFAHLDADLRRIPAEYLDAGGEFLVGERDTDDATAGTALVAMGGLQPAPAVDHHRGDDSVGVVRRMRVDPDHQRRGYGSTVLERLEARARDLAFERLVLDTTPRQEAAMALYESFGYEQRRREGTDVVEMVVYGKGL